MRVTEEADVVLAGRQAKTALSDRDFDETTIEEIVLVVHELASNIVKHADEGSIGFVSQSVDGRKGIEIHAQDSGPGIANVNQAITDGYSTAGSLGGGLGTVHRLMDDVVINATGAPGTGVEIVATRWNEPNPPNPTSPPFVVGAATRVKSGRNENGDAFLIEHGTDQTLVGVIDGLGHGEAAHDAAYRAQQHVRTYSSQPLADIFAGVERACRDSRGVVMVLARFEWDTDDVTLGGVGNVTVRVCHSPEPRHLVSKRGVLGGNAPTPVIEHWEWNPGGVMVIHSDGLASNWRCEEYSLDDTPSATEAANELLQSHSTGDDDATVLVVRRADR